MRTGQEGVLFAPFWEAAGQKRLLVVAVGGSKTQVPKLKGSPDVRD